MNFGGFQQINRKLQRMTPFCVRITLLSEIKIMYNSQNKNSKVIHKEVGPICLQPIKFLFACCEDQNLILHWYEHNVDIG